MRIRLPDFSMAYEDHGRGSPMLFIHGYPLNRRMWEPQLETLVDVARVIAPDLRCHGGSEPKPGHCSAPQAYSMDMLANDCAALLDAINITTPVVLCGLSMGGYISFAFYRIYPSRVRGLILAATRASADSPKGKAQREKAITVAEEAGASAISKIILPKIMSPKTYASQPEIVQQVNDIMQSTPVNGIIGDLMGMRARPDSTPMLPQINVPTLLLHGADDQIISLHEVEAMQDAIPDS